MRRFFRIQTRGISFDEMRGHSSTHEMPENESGVVNGLACSESVDDLRRYVASWLIGDGIEFEVVVFTGQLVERIYDGCVVEPAAEVMRCSVEELFSDDSLAEQESWD